MTVTLPENTGSSPRCHAIDEPTAPPPTIATAVSLTATPTLDKANYSLGTLPSEVFRRRKRGTVHGQRCKANQASSKDIPQAANPRPRLRYAPRCSRHPRPHLRADAGAAALP